MVRECKGCGLEKDLEMEFGKKGKSKTGDIQYRYFCKDCYNPIRRAQQQRRRDKYRGGPSTYNHNKGRRIDWNPASAPKSRGTGVKRRLKVWMESYKLTLSCADCNLSFKEFPFLVDFHHLTPATKDFELSRYLHLAGPNQFERVQDEVLKCVPLCPNCHRKRHFLYKNVDVS